MITASELPCNQLTGVSRLFLDYVNGLPELETLYDFRPDQKDYDYPTRRAQGSGINRGHLVNTIKQQYQANTELLPKALLDRLSLNNSCTVTTRHQLCIAGGPSYFCVQNCIVIQLVDKLSKMYNATVVPVYWMATEDHDVEEVRSVPMFGFIVNGFEVYDYLQRKCLTIEGRLQ